MRSGFKVSSSSSLYLYLSQRKALVNNSLFFFFSIFITFFTSPSFTSLLSQPNGHHLPCNISNPYKQEQGLGLIITPPAETSAPQPLMMSSTERLGFESSDERNVEDGHCLRKESSKRAKGSKIKKFPPPLSSFNRNGQPSFFLRSVRKDGRLVLTAVRNDRPEILVVSRQDGRLRLQLIKEEEKETQISPQVEEEEEEEKEQEKIEGWQFKGVSGEVLRRCNEVGIANHHYHHHNLHVWSHHCVPTM